jgi:23S rRNA-/tRNA-specific pseudouridylate synthase
MDKPGTVLFVHTEPAILYRSEHWLVLTKPSGWHSVAGSGDEPDIETWLRTRVPACSMLEEAGLVHRLDLPTSGCLLAATDHSTRQELRDVMSGRGDLNITKQYLARCRVGLAEQGEFDLHFTTRHRGSRKVTVSAQGEPHSRGRCEWRVLSRDSHRGELVRVDLLGPGRRHVIRAGFAHLGHPLAGDELYGGQAGTPQLHAWALVVGDVRVESPPPVWAT